MKLLVPLDGSKRSEEILPWAGAFLRIPQTRVQLLHVATERAADSEDRAPDDCGAYIAQVARRLRSERVESRVEVGDPAHCIVRHAKDHRVDLIAMRSRCRRGVSRMIFGSVAEEVLGTSGLPIFMIGPRAARAPTPARLRSVLVPLDTTRTSARILDVVSRLKSALGVRITLFHVVHGTLSGRVFSSWADQLSSPVRPLDCEVRLAFGGDVAAGILAMSSSSGSDCIAMSTHSRAGIRRLLLGSVAERVVAASPIPTLLIRSAGS